MKDIKLSVEDALNILEDPLFDKHSREYQYALTMAYRALARRVPKEPIKGSIDFKKMSMFHCPSCDNSISAFFEEVCASCGQVIDWKNVLLKLGGKNESS